LTLASQYTPIVGGIIHEIQTEKAPEAPASAGNLHAPMREGTGVDGGVSERWASEKRQKRLSSAD
jgi:hypothetical protein